MSFLNISWEKRISRTSHLWHVGLVVFLAVVSLLSVSWESPKGTAGPPWWAIMFSMIAFLIGSVALFFSVWYCYRLSPLRRANVVEMYTTVSLRDLLEESPTGFRNHVKALRNSVAKGLLKPGTQLFDDYVGDIESELKAHVRRSVRLRTQKLLLIWLYLFAIVVLVYACLYIADYALECWTHGGPGFAESFKPDKNTFEWLLEGVYYSVMLASTVGFGDLHPEPFPVPRVLAITEAIFAVIFLTIGLSHAIAVATCPIDLGDLAGRLRRHIAGSVEPLSGTEQ